MLFQKKVEAYPVVDGKISGMEDVAEAVREIDSKCSDTILDKNDLRYQIIKNDESKNSGSDSLNLVVNGKLYFLRYHPLNQLVSLMKGALKGQYVWQCLMYNKGELALDNIKAWEFSQSKPFFVRMFDDEVRGFLSDRYADYTNLELVDLVQATLLSMSDSTFIVSDYTVSEDYMIVYLSEPVNLLSEVKFGFRVSNSEVGLSAVNIGVTVTTKKNVRIQLQNASFKFVAERHFGKDRIKKRVEEYFSLIKTYRANVDNVIRSATSAKIDFLDEAKSLTEKYKLTKQQEEKFSNMVINAKPQNKLDMAEQIALLGEMFPSLRDDFEVKAGLYLSGHTTRK